MIFVWSVMLWVGYVYVFLILFGVSSGIGRIWLRNMRIGVCLLLNMMDMLILIYFCCCLSLYVSDMVRRWLFSFVKNNFGDVYGKILVRLIS